MRDWLVIQVRPRWEKKVARQLIEKGVESFCPLVKEKRQWSDRIKTIEKPLLPSYLFVRMHEDQRTNVRLTEGVVNFLYCNGKMVVLKEKLMQRIQQFLDLHPNLIAINTGGNNPIPAFNKKAVAISIEALAVILVARPYLPKILKSSTDNL